jgi:hypothetical protein
MCGQKFELSKVPSSFQAKEIQEDGKVEEVNPHFSDDVLEKGRN